MKRPSYRDAVNWLAMNDDLVWIEEPEFGPSPAAAVIRDIFDVTKEKLAADVVRELERERSNDRRHQPQG